MSESTLLNRLSGNRHSFNGLSLILSESYACHLNQVQVYERLNALWQGQKVNFTEEKRALFVAQRQFKQAGNNITDVNKFFQAQDDKMLSLVEAYEGIKNIICVGVGGSSWGLQCLNKAFKTTLLQKSKLIFTETGVYFFFDKFQSSITKGQFVVWYNKNELLGSGVID